MFTPSILRVALIALWQAHSQSALRAGNGRSWGAQRAPLQNLFLGVLRGDTFPLACQLSIWTLE